MIYSYMVFDSIIKVNFNYQVYLLMMDLNVVKVNIIGEFVMGVFQSFIIEQQWGEVLMFCIKVLEEYIFLLIDLQVY